MKKTKMRIMSWEKGGEEDMDKMERQKAVPKKRDIETQR